MKKPKIPNCQCAQCGKPKYKKPANLKLYPITFCDKGCHAQYKTISPVVNCNYCNTEFRKKIRDCKKTASNFCSRKCYGKSKETGSHLDCAYCSKKHYRPMYKFTQMKRKIFFCDIKCKTHFKESQIIKSINKPGTKLKPIQKRLFKAVHSRYIKLYKNYRDLALALLPNICSNPECLINKHNITLDLCQLEVDHIDMNRRNNTIQNLQILCAICHGIKSRIIDGRKKNDSEH